MIENSPKKNYVEIIHFKGFLERIKEILTTEIIFIKFTTLVPIKHPSPTVNKTERVFDT